MRFASSASTRKRIQYTYIHIHGVTWGGIARESTGERGYNMDRTHAGQQIQKEEQHLSSMRGWQGGEGCNGRLADSNHIHQHLALVGRGSELIQLVYLC